VVLTQGNTRRYPSLTQGHTKSQGILVVLLPKQILDITGVLW